MKTSWTHNRPFIFTILVCFFVSSTLSLPQISIARQAQAPNSEYRQAREGLALFYRELKKQRRSINETTFDPAALAEEIGSDIEDLFLFVRDQIQFEPYEGVLRLAQGTLMSRAGNANDQSLLLANLLRHHGYEVRYGFGELSEEQALQLLSYLPEPAINLARYARGNIDDVPLRGMSAEDLQKVLDQDQKMKDSFYADLFTEFDFAYDIVAGKLSEQGITPQNIPGKPVEELINVTRKHSWVQARHSGKWVDLDPVFPDNSVGRAVTDVSRTLDYFTTEEFAHKLRFKISISQLNDGKIVQKNVLDETIGLVDSISEIHVITMPEPPAGGAASYASPDFFNTIEVIVPSLKVNGRNIPGKPFNFQGTIVETDPDLRNAQKTRESVGAGFGALESTLGGIFGDSTGSRDPPSLERVDLEVTRISPSGATISQKRNIAKRMNGDSLPEEQVLFDLRRQFLTTTTYMATASRFTNQFIVARILDHYIANNRAMYIHLARQYGQELANEKAIIEGKLTELSLDLLDFFHTRSTITESSKYHNFPTVSAFAGTMQVIGFQQQINIDAEGQPVYQKRFDIMFHDIESFVPSQALQASPLAVEFRLQQGIIDTVLEYLVLGGGETDNTLSMIKKARQKNVKLVLVDDDLLDKISIDAEISSLIRESLAQGYLVIAPLSPVIIGGQSRFAWWRVDPLSGDVLGIGSAGHGNAMTEYSWMQGFAVGFLTSVGFCAFFQAIGMGSGWADYGRCVAVGTILGGPGGFVAHKWGLLGIMIFNLAACATLIGLDQVDIHPGGVRGRAMGPNQTAGDVAGNIAICFAIGMAAAGISYGIGKGISHVRGGGRSGGGGPPGEAPPSTPPAEPPGVRPPPPPTPEGPLPPRPQPPGPGTGSDPFPPAPPRPPGTPEPPPPPPEAPLPPRPVPGGPDGGRPPTTTPENPVSQPSSPETTPVEPAGPKPGSKTTGPETTPAEPAGPKPDGKAGGPSESAPAISNGEPLGGGASKPGSSTPETAPPESPAAGEPQGGGNKPAPGTNESKPSTKTTDAEPRGPPAESTPESGKPPARPLSESNNPEDYLRRALQEQGLSEPPASFKQKFSDGKYRYEVRAHEANPKFGKKGSIYRVARQAIPDPANPQAKGSGWEYLGSDNKWHHLSTLKPGKAGNVNPKYNDAASRDTHIQLPGTGGAPPLNPPQTGGGGPAGNNPAPGNSGG